MAKIHSAASDGNNMKLTGNVKVGEATVIGDRFLISGLSGIHQYPGLISSAFPENRDA